jgi:hypothetical protein
MGELVVPGEQWLFKVCLDQSGSALAGVNRWMGELVGLGWQWMYFISLDRSGSA